MAARNANSLQFNRPDIRADFERTRRELRANLLESGAEAALDELVDLGNLLDAGVARIKRDLLGSALCWNEENKQLIAWVQQQHAGVAEMGLKLHEALARGKPAVATVQRVSALALFHWGESVKWLMS